MNGNHLKYMLLGGAGVFGALLLVGVPLTSALLYAALLACPLMMFTMGGHGGHGGGGHDHTSRGAATRPVSPSTGRASTNTTSDLLRPRARRLHR